MISTILAIILAYYILTQKFYRYNREGLVREDNSLFVHSRWHVGKYFISRVVGIQGYDSYYGFVYRPIIAFFRSGDVGMVEFGISPTISFIILVRPVFPFIKFRLKTDVGVSL